MKEATLKNLVFGNEDFFYKYNYWRQRRFFYVDSVADFYANKDNPTFLSDLIFFSNSKDKLFCFNDVYLEKVSDEIFECGKEKGYTARVYKLSDESGELPCFWPTRDSKLIADVSCDQFEIMKNFRGNFVKQALVIGFQNRMDTYIYHVSPNEEIGKRQTRKIKLPELIPERSPL